MLSLQNKWLVFLLINVIASTVYAASQTQNIDIKAHSLLLDEKKGISKYKGNVLFTKGSLIIKADTVTLYHNDNKLIKVLITGSPADVQHQPENEAKVHSQANKMEYLVAEERLFLNGQAFVDQGDRHFSGESIEYDTRQRIITASGNPTTPSMSESPENSPPKGRVHVIIGPVEDAEENKNVDEQ